MKLTITIKINTNNAAFEGERCSYEVTRIVKQALEKITPHIECLPEVQPNDEYRLLDINGNYVGTVKIKGVKS